MRPTFTPLARRDEIDALCSLIYHTVNDGVYRAGLAASQAAYDEARDALFATPRPRAAAGTAPLPQPEANPSRIVPRGPCIDWLSPHGRERLPEQP